MPYQIDWITKNRVIYLNLRGDLSPTDLRTAYDALIVYYEQGDEPMYLLVDHTKLTQYPIGLNAYDFLIGGNPATKFEQALVIGPNRQARFLVRLFARVRHIPSVSFETKQEALAYLHQHSAVLSDANIT